MRLTCRHQLLTCFTLILFLQAMHAFGGIKEDTVIKRVVQAYGGNSLTKLKSIKVHSRYKTFSASQSTNPEITDVYLRNTSLVIDFDNQRSSLETWTKNANGARLGKVFYDGKTGHSINYMRGTHVDRPDLTFASVMGSDVRLLDTALARDLFIHSNTAEYQGEVVYKSCPHDVLSVLFNGTSKLTLYIDKSSGFISKMSLPGGFTYVYSDYQAQEGVKYAADTTYLVSGEPNLITLSKSIELNPKIDEEFEIPVEITTIPGGMLDTSEPITKKLADGIYFVGQNSSYSLFIDAGDYFIEAGGISGLSQRLTWIKEATNSNKPLKYQIISFHGHVDGAEEAIKLGAQLITVDSNIPLLSKTISTSIPEKQLTLVSDSLRLADGRVQVFDISTSLAEHNLIVYIPETKSVFSLDHFSTQVKNALPGPSNNALTYLRALDALNLEIETLYDAHTPKSFTLNELRSVANNYVAIDCLPGHEVCSGYGTN